MTQNLAWGSHLPCLFACASIFVALPHIAQAHDKNTNSSARKDNACTKLTGHAMGETRESDAVMLNYADECSGSELGGGVICRSTKDFLLEKGGAYRTYALRMKCLVGPVR